MWVWVYGCGCKFLPKSSNAPPGLGVSQELQVQERTTTAGEAGEDLLPILLALVAVGELDVDVLEGEGLLAQLLETDDNVVGGGVDPALLLDDGAAGLLELGVIEDAGGAGLVSAALLDADLVAGVDEGLGGGGRQGGAVLEGLSLGAQVEDGGRHVEGVFLFFFWFVWLLVGCCWCWKRVFPFEIQKGQLGGLGSGKQKEVQWKSRLTRKWGCNCSLNANVVDLDSSVMSVTRHPSHPARLPYYPSITSLRFPSLYRTSLTRGRFFLHTWTVPGPWPLAHAAGPRPRPRL